MMNAMTFSILSRCFSLVSLLLTREKGDREGCGVEKASWVYDVPQAVICGSKLREMSLQLSTRVKYLALMHLLRLP